MLVLFQFYRDGKSTELKWQIYGNGDSHFELLSSRKKTIKFSTSNPADVCKWENRKYAMQNHFFV